MQGLVLGLGLILVHWVLVIEFSPNSITEFHRLDGLNTKHLFLTILEAGKSKIKAQVDLASGEDLLLGS